MELRALIFDWDQTLLDSWGVHRDAIRRVAGSAGLEIPSEEEIIGTFTGTLDEHLRLLFGQMDGLLEVYGQYYREHHLVDARLFPRVSQLLEHLQREGYRLGLLSNKARRMAEAELEHWELADAFDLLVFRDDLGVMKPEPDGLNAILEGFGVPAPSALYVGDGPVDVQVARRAGTWSAAALWGTLDEPGVLAESPDLVWREVEESLAFFQERAAPSP